MPTQKTISKQKIKVRGKVIYILLLILLWFIISSALLDIQLEQFQNTQDYVRLGLWMSGILVGYMVLVFVFWRTIKKKRE